MKLINHGIKRNLEKISTQINMSFLSAKLSRDILKLAHSGRK